MAVFSIDPIEVLAGSLGRRQMRPVDSCVVVYSGVDTTVLFVWPLNEWTGPQHGVTVGVLAQIQAASPRCYDVNVSFPRYAAVAGDSAVRWTPKKRQPLKVMFLDTGELSFSGGFPYAATKA